MTITLYCGFCAKSQDEVKKLIAGPNTFICNECTMLCFNIITDETDPITLPRPAGWRKGQTIFNFLWWLKRGKGMQAEHEGVMVDPFHITDVEWDVLYAEFLRAATTTPLREEQA